MTPARTFGKVSLDRLKDCHPDLQRLFLEVVKHYDCAVTCGHRGEADQELAFAQKKSKVHFPNSKHNSLPSMAADVVPFPIDWKDTKRFYHFIGYVMATAEQMGIKVRSGSDWDRDMDLTDQKFIDLPHFELVVEGSKDADTQ